MDAQTFRLHGRKMVDWVADYIENVEKFPVLPGVLPGEIRDRLPGDPPDEPENMEAIFSDFIKLVLPGVTHWNHPRFFAYFPANHSGPAILAELLSAALGVNGMVWQSCPSATELEELVMEWLRKLLTLPEGFHGSIQDTASTATLCALLCARERISGFDINREGPDAWARLGPLRVYASGEAHSSVEKGMKIAGFGSANLVKVEVDRSRAMDPSDLERKIRADQDRGFRPAFVVATVGTTSSTAIDPLRPIGEIARRHKVWLHVDAALAGSAAILPEKRAILDGVELCDSFVFNPHKWLFTNFDCSAFYCRDPELLQHTFSIAPEYLKTDQDRRVTNFRDWGIPLGRRFRALKLWFVLRFYGAEGLRTLLRKHLALAQEFKTWVEQSPEFELLAPVPLQTVCFRCCPPAIPDEGERDKFNKDLMDRVNRSGRIFITHTRLDDKFCLRMSIGQIRTERRHVEEAWQVLQEEASGLVASFS
jgi:aromatic-L-amino-acid/L-tryptophan decarboxylase